jgi:Phosphotransferase enzyme family
MEGGDEMPTAGAVPAGRERVDRGASDGADNGGAPLQAWQTLSLPRPVLQRAAPVQRKKRKAEVWRLSGPQAGDHVLAKRCRLHEAAREDLVYCRVLPQIRMQTVQYLGRVDTGDGQTAWLFMKEVVGGAYAADEPLHRELAADWLSALHCATHNGPPIEGLPDVGPLRYRTMLEDLVRILPEAACNQELGRTDVEVLDEAATCCRYLLELWPSVESAAGHLPHTLVHGSFSGRNMLVTSTSAATGPVLSVFDWGAAGWGVPARDLGNLVSPKIAGTVATYWRRFPDVTASDRDLLVALGRIFRAVEHMTWVAPRLSYPWVEEPMRRAAFHGTELVAACDALRRLV